MEKSDQTAGRNLDETCCQLIRKYKRMIGLFREMRRTKAIESVFPGLFEEGKQRSIATKPHQKHELVFMLVDSRDRALGDPVPLAEMPPMALEPFYERILEIENQLLKQKRHGRALAVRRVLDSIRKAQEEENEQ